MHQTDKAFVWLAGVVLAGIAAVLVLSAVLPQRRPGGGGITRFQLSEEPPGFVAEPPRPASPRTAPKPATSWEEEFQAKRYCRRAVLASLKAPSTAKFAGSVKLRQTGTERWLVSGQVDAQNSFGAMLRSYYVCEITRAGSGWRVERVLVE